jgi:peptidoglycan/LPS O-acetylase OafA/YrhL
MAWQRSVIDVALHLRQQHRPDLRLLRVNPALSADRVPQSVRPEQVAVHAPQGGYRTDINGLRAWAVFAVVLYHFGIPGFAGGFVGVDVFFVISGFLMTSILTQALARGRRGKGFFLSFYIARAVRIVPALLVLCAVLLIAGWFVFPPGEFQQLGKHVAAGLGFFSNRTYQHEAGYFDVSALDKWLLHTWSLSVEWQFYLLFPPALALTWKARPRRSSLLIVIGLGCAASLLLAILITPSKPVAAFFSLPTRSWEMFAGGLVYLLSDLPPVPPQRARLLEAIGLACIVASIVLFSSTTSWPGWRATIPVVGTVAVLVAHRSRSMWTGTRGVQWIGTCSYSIYLWHWPVIVALAYFDVHREPLALALGLMSSLLLGWLSYRFVEKGSARLLRLGGSKRPLGWLVFSAFAMFGIALLAADADGRFIRPHATVDALDAKLVMPLSSNGWCFRNVEVFESVPLDPRSVPCRLGDRKAAVTGLLIGDSFAGQYEPFWDRVGRSAGLAIDAVTTNWCYPRLDDDYVGPQGGRGNQQCRIDRLYFREHVAQYDVVVFAGLWNLMFKTGGEQGLYAAIAKAAAVDKLVFVMAGPTLFDTNIAAQYRRRHVFGLPFSVGRFTKQNDATMELANRELETFCQRFANVIFIGRDSMFGANGRASDVTIDNIPFSVDGSHISVYGAESAAGVFLSSPTYRDRINGRLEALSRAARGAKPIAAADQPPR